MTEKRSVQVFLGFTIMVIVALLSTLYVYDPLQVFHKHNRTDDFLNQNMRLQAAGLIEHYDFDSMILGTSILENTSAKEASELLGGQFINISISDSDFFERSLIMQHAFNTKPIKKVIYSFDVGMFFEAREGSEGFLPNTFDFLYDDNSINNIKVYLNDKYIECLVTLSSSALCLGRKTDLDRPNAWYKIKEERIRFGGLDHWFKAKNNHQIKTALKNIIDVANRVKKGEHLSLDQIETQSKASRQYVDKYLMSFIKAHEDTEFIIVIPPFSRILWSMWAQYNKPTFEIYQLMTSYIVSESNQYKNMKVFDWSDQDFPDDIRFYKDTYHYHHSINSQMLQAIKDDTGLLNTLNIKDFMNKTTQKAQAFDLIGFGQKIDQLMAK